MLRVEIADTPQEHQVGLMFRGSLPDDHGMFFRFASPGRRNFWGLNTYIPLDIAFVDPDNKIMKIDRIKPFSMKAVGSDEDCISVIEANEGFFVKNNIKVGDKIFFKSDEDDRAILFKKSKDK